MTAAQVGSDWARAQAASFMIGASPKASNANRSVHLIVLSFRSANSTPLSNDPLAPRSRNVHYPGAISPQLPRPDRRQGYGRPRPARNTTGSANSRPA